MKSSTKKAGTVTGSRQNPLFNFADGSSADWASIMASVAANLDAKKAEATQTKEG